MRYLFCIGISIMLLVSFTLLAEAGKINKTGFYDQPTCPIKIEISKSESRVYNVSNKLITQYQLGCVRNVKGKSFTVISKMMPNIIDIKAGNFILETVDSGNIELFNAMKKCNKQNGQIMALEVLFEGADKWQLQPIQK